MRAQDFFPLDRYAAFINDRVQLLILVMFTGIKWFLVSLSLWCLSLPFSVSLCEAHTDWPSAQNQLTYNLRAVINIPLRPPSRRGKKSPLGICGLVPNLPWYHLLLFFSPLSLYVYPFLFTDTKDLIQDCFVSHFWISLYLHKVTCLRPKSASEHANSLYTKQVKAHTYAPQH